MNNLNDLFGNLPKGVRFLIVLFIVGLLIAGGLNHEALNSLFKPGEVKYADVHFVVLDFDSKQPLEGVKVQFIFDGAPEPTFTNTDGYANIKIPKRSDIIVLLQKTGFSEKNHRLNLEVQSGTRVLYLEKIKDKGYKLNSSYLKGAIFKEVSLSKFTAKSLGLNPEGGNSMNLKMNISIISNANKDIEREILEVDQNGKPYKFKEKILEDLTVKDIIVNVDVDYRYKSGINEKRKFNYNYPISEIGSFKKNSILYEKQDRVWRRKLIGVDPNNAQKDELSQSWDWESSFFEYYPNRSIEIGQSWDMTKFSGNILGNDIIITDASIKGTLAEIINCEGAKCAVVSMEGSFSYKDLGSQSDQGSFEKLFAKDFYNDLAESFITKDIAQDLAIDLYRDEHYFYNRKDDSEYQLTEGLNTELREIYREVYVESGEDKYKGYSLKDLENSILNKMSQHSFSTKLADMFVSKSKQKDKSIQKDNGKAANVNIALKGKIYRNLESLIDVESKIDFTITMNLGEESPDFMLKGEGSYASRMFVPS